MILSVSLPRLCTTFLSYSTLIIKNRKIVYNTNCIYSILLGNDAPHPILNGISKNHLSKVHPVFSFPIY